MESLTSIRQTWEDTAAHIKVQEEELDLLTVTKKLIMRKLQQFIGFKELSYCEKFRSGDNDQTTCIHISQRLDC